MCSDLKRCFFYKRVKVLVDICTKLDHVCVKTDHILFHEGQILLHFSHKVILANGSVTTLNNVSISEVRVISDLFINNHWLATCILLPINLSGSYIYIKTAGKYKGHCLSFFKELQWLWIKIFCFNLKVISENTMCR